jgi:type II secretory pathway pseudopilin PulG
MLTRKPFSKIRGLTLLETMFAIAIGALVLIGAVIFYLSTKQNANTNKAVGDMNSIVAATESYLAGGNSITDLSGVTNAVVPLQTGGYLPKPIYDPWGQEYTAVVAKSDTTSTITIKIPGIVKEDNNCQAIVQAAIAGGSATDASTAKTDCALTYVL